MTLADYSRKCEGYRRKQLTEWQHTRSVAFTMYRMLGGKDSAQKFMPLDDDVKEVAEKDLKAVQENFKRIKEFYNGRSKS